MSSDALGNSPDRDNLRAYLSRWAARLTRDPMEQQRLIEQTIAVALDDPDVLDAADVDGALERLMHRLISPDNSTRLSASARE